jgi:L-malate glycosyltransferase
LKSKYEFIFALPHKSGATELVKRCGFKVIEVPMLELSRRWQSILFYIPVLTRSAYCVRKIVKEHRIDLVHVNDFYNLIMPLWRSCGGRTLYVCHVNFVPDRFPSLLRKLWISSHLNFANSIIAVSQHVLRQLPISNKIICIPNALPAQRNADPENRQRRKVLLFVGNFMEGKGQDMAIRSFALIAKFHPQWKLRFIGGDMGLRKNRVYRAGLVTLSEGLNVEEQVEWEDFSGDVKHEYEEASIALNFSRSESFSLTVQEAMFYGCPVIATQSGGPEELIEDHHSGLLVGVDDTNAMSEAMSYLIENPEACSRIGRNAARSIREKCSTANTVDQLDRVYQAVLNA